MSRLGEKVGGGFKDIFAERILIELEIADRVKLFDGDYRTWHIGLSHEPARKKLACHSQGMRVERWAHWELNSLVDARQILTYFSHVKQMQACDAEALSHDKPVCIYIF